MRFSTILLLAVGILLIALPAFSNAQYFGGEPITPDDGDSVSTTDLPPDDDDTLTSDEKSATFSEMVLGFEKPTWLSDSSASHSVAAAPAILLVAAYGVFMF